MRNRVLFLLACISVAAVAAIANAQVAVHTYSVINSGATAYLFDGSTTPNPTLTLTRGKRYAFAINATGHPFDIKTAPGSGTGNQYNIGVSAQGQTSATITFDVDANAPSTLFYQCEAHNAMNGQILTVAATPSPALGGPQAALMLGAVVLGAAFVMLRRRRSLLEQ